eukprot:gene9217-10193_t
MAATRITTVKSDKRNREGKLHLMPCEVKHSGEANVDEYFETCIREDNSKLVAEADVKQVSFRGRPLKGQKICLPSNYKGVIMKEERKPVTDGQERTLVPQMLFTNFNYWNLDTNPSSNDPILKALQWTQISKAVSIK